MKKYRHPSTLPYAHHADVTTEKLNWYHLDTITISGHAVDTVEVGFDEDHPAPGGRRTVSQLKRVYALGRNPKLAKLARRVYEEVKRLILQEWQPDIFADDLCDSCVASGCCRTYYEIMITEEDVLRMEKVLGKSRLELQREGRIVLDPDHWTGDFVGYLGYREDETPGYSTPCANLDENLHRCTIYEARPTACRAWPSNGCTYYCGPRTTKEELEEFRAVIDDGTLGTISEDEKPWHLVDRIKFVGRPKKGSRKE